MHARLCTVCLCAALVQQEAWSCLHTLSVSIPVSSELMISSDQILHLDPILPRQQKLQLLTACELVFLIKIITFSNSVDAPTVRFHTIEQLQQTPGANVRRLLLLSLY